MFWLILLILNVPVLIYGIYRLKKYGIIGKTDDDYSGIGLTFISGLIIFLILCILPFQYFSYKKEINNFKMQKHYIEEVVPTLETTDNYALTQKRIELNGWLYDAQYKKQKFGIFTVCPEEVLELEEIK